MVNVAAHVAQDPSLPCYYYLSRINYAIFFSYGTLVFRHKWLARDADTAADARWDTSQYSLGCADFKRPFVFIDSSTQLHCSYIRASLMCFWYSIAVRARRIIMPSRRRENKRINCQWHSCSGKTFQFHYFGGNVRKMRFQWSNDKLGQLTTSFMDVGNMGMSSIGFGLVIAGW